MASASANNHQQKARPEKEWTRVHRKGRRRGKSPHHDTYSEIAGTVSNSTRSSSLSACDIMEEHKRITHQWESSACRHKLHEIFEPRIAHLDISDAICFGTGSFDPEDGSWEIKRKAHIQLAAFLSIVDQFQRGSSRRIRCVFQEPAFNASDKGFIRALGHEVVDSPIGFEQVSPSTLVFGIHLYRDIYAQAIAKCIPAMFIGTPREVWEECYGSDRLNWVELDELNEKCEKVKFPDDAGYTTFSSTAIHWRRCDET
ncbi:uncharacterized protein F4812DRAFT_453949 [Daldinia caldariorum]|uniref:uncharacterized protein n=1 Tax=Daldinia caldariorum TaxID=326644 RepID=UPI002007B5C0|nr:uncharacterized protein F4812DRAFT_453949 [Daldinia caldariorum]KAI1472133.1 hypothetical protein F4812DRAFT_453949 [Daldinia caldariorum]